MATVTKRRSAEDIAAHLSRQNAYRVLVVLIQVSRIEGFRGKVNLGHAAGVRPGNNSYAARPVESAVRMGLIDQRRDGAAYVYQITDLGRAVLELSS